MTDSEVYFELKNTSTRQFYLESEKKLLAAPPWVIHRVAVISAKNHKRQRRERQSVTANREKAQTPKVLTAILTLPNLTKPNLT